MKWHHVIFWVAFLVFSVMSIALETGPPLPVSVVKWLLFSGSTVSGILLIRVALARWRLENPLAVMGAIIAAMVGTIFLELFLEELLLRGQSLGPKQKLVENVMFMWPWLLIALAIDLAAYSQEKKLDKSKAELVYLRHQLSPHFLLNTHNNINFLIEQDPQLASRTLLKLSGIMQYMLYECNADQVSLSKELAHLENYIGLEKIRKENVQVSYNFSYPSSEYQIAPLLLITFVENAFKHVSVSAGINSYITISSFVNNGVLKFEVTNTAGGKTGGDGIGLANARRRLQILYRNKHKLEIKKNEGLYSVQLSIELDKQ